MNQKIVKIISEQTETLFHNVNIMLMTCCLDAILYNQPIWKHVYHMLHSLDRWFINPDKYTEPLFHTPGLNSLDAPSENALSREDLRAYCEGIRTKIFLYLETLTDDLLTGTPEGCVYSRMALILGQYRHTYAHLGTINATTIGASGKWPRLVGLNSEATDALWE